ncbi:hypothetical protein KUTeg_011022 [Tegillarca granosa]|uniref:C2H2-type domain-containing protein n=1 Tax=Tegillarca granosa TaxID=220873 RepID=A0ABQ9F720_TEGGR|nr:hypothetical protein KUTeg_011022 [Tegillarca granosa]
MPDNFQNHGSNMKKNLEQMLVGHSRLDMNKIDSVVRVTSPSESGKNTEEQELPEGESSHTEMASGEELVNDGHVMSHVPESEQNGGKMQHEDDGLFYIDVNSEALNHEGVDNSEYETNFSVTKKSNGRFVCNVCQKEFSSHYAQKRHMMSHYDNRPNKCDICGKAFIGKQNLQVHYRIHTGEKPYRCKYCHKKFTQYGTMYRHTQLHLKGRLGGTSIQTNTSLKTELTGDGMDRKQTAKKKMNVVNDLREEGVSQYSKNVYPTVVDKKGYFQNNFDDNSDSNAAVIDLSMHEEKSHSHNEHNAGDVSKLNYDKSYNMGINKKDENFSEINQTVNTNMFDSNLTDKFVDRDSVISDDKNANVTNSTMSKEDNSVLQEEGYRNGVHGGQSYNNELHGADNSDPLSSEQTSREVVRCDICDVTFENPESLESHQNLHREGNLHMCLVCGKGFAMGYTLRRHMMIHSNQKPHVCDICGKSFIEKQHLQSHYRVHSSERPYECLYCDKRFPQYETLHDHLQTHKNNQEISQRPGETDHKNQEISSRQREMHHHIQRISPRHGEIIHKNQEISPRQGEMHQQRMSPRQGEIIHKNQEMLPRQGHSTDSVNFATNEDSIKITKETKLHSNCRNDTNVKYETGNMLIKQEVISEDDGIKNEGHESFNGENIIMASDDNYRMRMIDNNGKMHSNQDKSEKLSNPQMSSVNNIKQENLEVEYPSVLNYSAINPGKNIFSVERPKSEKYCDNGQTVGIPIIIRLYT